MTWNKLVVLAGLALLAACGPKAPPVVVAPPPPPPPAPPPPPPPVVIVVPPRPVPPMGAQLAIAIPPLSAEGVRQTVNAKAPPLEQVWNFRAAWNVAALNCLDPRYQPVLDAYKAFLIKHKKRLTAVNTQIDKDYRKRVGAGATKAREAYLTQVYNFFALPPVNKPFCDAALAMAQEALASPPKDMDIFATASLPRLEAPFNQFFADFEQYQIDVAAWDAKWGDYYAKPEAAAPANSGTTLAQPLP